MLHNRDLDAGKNQKVTGTRRTVGNRLCAVARDTLDAQIDHHYGPFPTTIYDRQEVVSLPTSWWEGSPHEAHSVYPLAGSAFGGPQTPQAATVL